MAVTRNTGRKKPATAKRKTPTRGKPAGAASAVAAKKSDSASLASAAKTPAPAPKPTTKASSASTAANTIKPTKDNELAKSTQQESKVLEQSKVPSQAANAAESASNRSSSNNAPQGSAGYKGQAALSSTSRQGVSSILVYSSLIIAVVSIIAAGYAVYTAQFDLQLERLRLNDQVEFLQEQGETLRESRSTMEASIANLRLNAAEIEARNQERLSELRSQISVQEDLIIKLNALSLDELDSRLQSLQKQLASLAQNIVDIETYFQGGVEAWSLKEVGQLLSIADYRLRFTGEYLLALDALEIADERLAALNNANLYEVRRLLDQDMLELSSIATVDSLSLLKQLRILHDRVPFLPLLGDLETGNSTDASAQKTSSASTSSATTNQPTSSQKPVANAIVRFFDSLRDLIQIEKNNHPVRPILSSEIRQIIYERTWLLLESAESALIRRQYALVAERLNIVKNWVVENFAMNSDITADWITLLDGIANSLPKDVPPDLSESIEALQSAIVN